jgi:hypothetical protein
MSATATWIRARPSHGSGDEFCLESAVLVFKLQYASDADEVEAGRHQDGDLLEPVDVVAAVAPGTAFTATGRHQSLPFVDPKCLGVQAGQMGCHGDGVDAQVGIFSTIAHHTGPSNCVAPIVCSLSQRPG